MHTRVVRDRGLDRVGVRHDDDELPGMVGDDSFERGDHPRLHRCQRLAGRERRPGRGALHDLPEVGLGEIRELLAGPVAVVGLEDAIERAHDEPVMVGDGLRGLRRALDRARVDRFHRQPRETLAQRGGLAAPFLGQVDARGAT